MGMSDKKETIRVSVFDDTDCALTEVEITIPREELDGFVSDFEDHFIGNYDEAELL